MPAACRIMLRVFPGTVWSLSINGSLNTNGLVIAEVYSEPEKLVYFTRCGKYYESIKWIENV